MSRTHSLDGDFYHVYNRGADKRTIFTCESDYIRFLEGLFVFNDRIPVGEGPFQKRKKMMNGHIDHPLTELMAFSLMPNHFHLLLRRIEPNGISKLMHDVGTGYTNYFNRNQNRKGRLFENPFQSRPIDSDGYLEHLVRYIHLNPLSLLGVNWKTNGVSRNQETETFLINYRWSSLCAYLKDKPHLYYQPEATQTIFPDPKEHFDYLFEYEPTGELEDDVM